VKAIADARPLHAARDAPPDFVDVIADAVDLRVFRVRGREAEAAGQLLADLIFFLDADARQLERDALELALGIGHQVEQRPRRDFGRSLFALQHPDAGHTRSQQQKHQDAPAAHKYLLSSSR